MNESEPGNKANEKKTKCRKSYEAVISHSVGASLFVFLRFLLMGSCIQSRMLSKRDST